MNESNIISKDIAIISMACRFPDAENVEQFFDNLIQGVSSIKEIPKERWLLDNFYSSTGEPGKSNSKYGSFLKDIKSLDPDFFKINPNDARIMDPQQRILIELAYETITSSKYSLDELRSKKVGVFLGISKCDYREHVQAALINGELNQNTVIIGILRNIIPARISNLFDFQGPSLAIDTACSSSLVAIQTAIESILNGTSELALVGGINLNITPACYLGMSMSGALTSNSIYHVFDEKSNGFIMGEGGGLVLLKKLQDAINDNDTILGVIKGSAVNNDGKSISSMSPRPLTQQMVIKEAYENAGINTSEVNYIEAHGTGTSLGDAIEAQSIIKLFHPNTIIGSVKPNIGHLISGSGIACLIKSLLIIKNRLIPPLLNYSEPRKKLKLEESGFILNTKPIKIEKDKLITIGVNSFGFGGTNAHIILQEYNGKNNKVEYFKQIIPNYNKKEYWIPLKSYLKGDSINDEIPLYTSNLVNENINIEKDYNQNTFIFSSYEKQDLVHKLVRFLNVEEIKTKLIFDFEHINEKNTTIIFIEPDYGELLEKLQNLLRSPFLNNVSKILVITDKAIVSNEDKSISNIDKIITSGLIFSSISEFKNIKITQIDFDESFIQNDKLSIILAELKNEKYERLVIYRNKQRKVFKIEKINEYNKKTKIIKGNVYLVTGISGIITEIIKHLSTYQVSLIICSRRDKNAIKEWNELELYVKNNNSQIELIKTDISKSDEVKRAFSIINDKYKSLNGIIHGAGIVIPSSFEKKDITEFYKVLEPKVLGIKCINQELDNYNFNPDFITSFSSLSSIVAGLNKGISDYSTANFFLDQYSKLMRNNNKNFYTINWGPWEETGMASNPLLLKKLLESGITPLNTKEALFYFDKILNSSLNQVIVVKTEERNLIYSPKIQENLEILPNNNVKKVKKDDVKKEEQDITNFSYVELQDFLLKLVSEEINLKFDNSKLNIDSNLLDLGIDSLSAIEMAKKLQNSGFNDVPFELFFEYQTIRAISDFLLKDKKIDAIIEHEKEFFLSPLQTSFYKIWSISESLSFSFQRQTFTGNLDINILEKAFHLILKKHEQLRSNFFIKKENDSFNIIQKISEYNNYKNINIIKFKDLAINEDINQIEDDFVNKKFDLEKDILFNLLLVKEKNNFHLLILIHHIIFDGISMKIFSEELWSNYQALLKDINYDPESLKSSYFDYIKYISKRDFNDDFKWWKDKIENYYPNLTNLKESIPNINDNNIISAVYTKVINKSLSEKINTFSQTKQIPLQVLYLSAYCETLLKWLDINEITINLAVSGRDISINQVNKIIGCFADTYPVYYNKNMDKNNLRTQIQELKKHQSIGSSEIVKFFKDSNKIYSPFAFSFAIFDKSWANKIENINFLETSMRGFNINTKFTLTFWEDFQGINYSINYQKNTFNQDVLDNFSYEFNKNLELIINDDSYDKNYIINNNSVSFNSEAEIKINKKIVSNNLSSNNFVKQIIKNSTNYPDKISLVFEDQVINYESLGKKSAFIAGSLLKRGLNSNSTIAIIASSSIEFIITLIAILRIGATWVPIDSNYPKERIEKMIEISQSNSVIYTDELFSSNLSKNYLFFNDLIKESFLADFIVDIELDKTAYIIFTSGSTGEPKGVPISYEALENYLTWCNKTFDYNFSDKFIQTSSICFDASIRQILAPLICGGTVYPVSREVKLDAKLLLNFVQKNDISVWSSVPSLWSVFLQALEKSLSKELPNLRMIKLGGEVLKPDLVRKTQKLLGNIKIVNLYGPTETTINATYHVIDSILDDSVSNIPIGIPSSNLKCSIHFLNDNIDLDSQEEIGELWVSGIGLTSGYINSIDLNSKKFIIDELNTRYYRTGDLVSKNKKGEYIFHGRIDQQIKIRGFRVEIGEIENILLANNKISNVVIKFENNLLSSFIESETLEKEDISNYLANKLPEYLIPNKIVVLKKFPLMENGKIDINNIKEVDDLFIQIKELSNTELIISKIWEKLLNIKVINPDVSFFSLGGDSILIMQMFLKLEEYFTKLPKISAFYKNGKLSYLANLIDDLNKSIILEEEIPKKDDFNNKFGLSPSQIGFFLVNKFTKKQDTSWKAVFCIEGKIDLKNFQKALNLITKRHQMLNVKLVSDTIPYFQMEENIINFPFVFEEKNSEEKKLIDINNLIPNLINNMDEELINLNEWPLLKLKLIKVSESEFLIAINSHHILGDALSILILLKELSYTYTMLQLQKTVSLIPLKKQFSDYVNIVNNGLEVDKIASLNYWKNIFKSQYKKPELEIINDTFFKYKETINKNSFKSLKELSISFDSTPFNLILTIFYRALSKFLNEKDLVIGIAHHGRDFSLLDINKIFGCFAKSIPIRIKDELELENQVKNIHNNIKESSFFELNTIELIKEISSGVNFNTLLGSQFFLSYIDVTEEENQNEKLLKIDWEKSYSDFEPYNLNNDIFLAVKKNNNELTLSFNLSNFYDKERFITLFKNELAFITNNNKTKSDIIFNYEKLNKENFGTLDSALIGYLPSKSILNKLSISETFLKQSIFKKEKSFWLEGIKSNLGNSGFISIPFFAEEINLANSKIILEHIFSAIEQAKNLGAKYISLAGMLPAVTEYGKCLSEIKIPIITTGHSTTVSAVIKNTVAILDRLKIDVTSKTIAFIGLGSIGTATALSLLKFIPHPEKIILCDIYGSEKRIKEIEIFLKKELFFNGIIETKISSKNISDSIYEADMMICAVSSSNILDIDKLKQNCIVIDDSFPHCFDVNNAIERMEISKDIFVIGGGLLDIGNFERTIYLPFENELLKEYLTKNIISKCIASCQLESLLMVKNPQLNITTGLVDYNQVLEYISVINNLEIKPSTFHLGNYLLRINNS